MPTRAFEKYKKTQKSKDRMKRYRQTHPGLLCAKNRKRELDKIQRCPSWANIEKIRQFYENCPKGMVVDHIIPLRGKLVSGFHVESNLQYLTPKENLKKGNKFNFEEYTQSESGKNWVKRISKMTSQQYSNKVR